MSMQISPDWYEMNKTVCANCYDVNKLSREHPHDLNTGLVRYSEPFCINFILCESPTRNLKKQTYLSDLNWALGPILKNFYFLGQWKKNSPTRKKCLRGCSVQKLQIIIYSSKAFFLVQGQVCKFILRCKIIDRFGRRLFRLNTFV